MELFKLFGTIAIDNSGANRGIDETTDKAEEAQSKISSSFGRIGDAAIKVGKVVATGLAAGSAAISALVANSVDNYGEYEQLVGGIETLFKTSADKVKEYAANAYKTAGLSVNEYMETATSFSASLIQSLASHTSESYEASLEALERHYEAVEDSTESALELLEESQEKEVEAFEAATDAKIALIDKQYTENLKLIDEEKYNQIKAIDEQIAKLNEQTEAERAAAEKKKQEQKIASLEEKINTAKDAEAKIKAEQDLANYLEEVAQKERESLRKAQIEELKDQKQAVKDQADAKKEVLKEQYESEKKAIKDESAAQLKELKKAQKAELNALKKSNSEKLKEAKKYVAEQSELLEASATSLEYTSEVYQEAAEYANLAIIDMSDNANKMGTDMAMIQNAYQGFAKANYTMLDNLKLGYGGTKEEMERLLADAEKLTGIKYDISSFADIVDAIHVIQTEIGITGTTAKEAGSTIQGSVSSMKAAWSNLVTGLSDDNANLEKLVGDFVDSVGTAAGNIIPRIEIALQGSARLINELFPVVMAEIPRIITEILPDIVSSAANIVKSLVDGISENKESIMDTAFEVIMILVNTITELLPQIFDLGIELLVTIANGIVENLDTLIPAAIEMLDKIIDTITEPETLGALVNAAVDIILALADGLVKFLPRLVEASFSIIEKIATELTQPDTLVQILNAAADIIMALVQGLNESLPRMVNSVRGIIVNLTTILQDGESRRQLLEAAGELIKQLALGILQSITLISDTWEEIRDDIVDAILDVDWVNVGRDIMKALSDGLREAWNEFASQDGSIISMLSNLMNFSSPIGAMRSFQMGNMVSGVAGLLDGSHADGLNYVPYDGYIAELHKGEMVVPAAESEFLRSGSFGANNEGVIRLLERILSALQEREPQNVSLSINNREFARMVKAVN